MGKMGAAFYQQLEQTRYCRLVAWADRDPEQFANKTASVRRILPQDITAYAFDYLVIAIQNRKTAEQVAKVLSAMGIPERKIVW